MSRDAFEAVRRAINDGPSADVVARFEATLREIEKAKDAAARKSHGVVIGQDLHDDRCESEFITGPMAWSPCDCNHRAHPVTTPAAPTSDRSARGAHVSDEKPGEGYSPPPMAVDSQVRWDDAHKEAGQMAEQARSTHVVYRIGNNFSWQETPCFCSADHDHPVADTRPSGCHPLLVCTDRPELCPPACRPVVRNAGENTVTPPEHPTDPHADDRNEES